MNLLCVVLVAWAAAAPAKPGMTFVNGRISANMSGTFEIYEPFLQVNQWINPWSGGATVNGFPLSGNVSGGSKFMRFFGHGASADINEFGGQYRVNANINRRGSNRPVQLSFTLVATGPQNDPARPPTFQVWAPGSNLSIQPTGGGRDYNVTGWIDKEEFGAEGVALAGIVVSMAMNRRPSAYAPCTLEDLPKLSDIRF